MMATRLEERLRRYGETLERAVVTDAAPELAHIERHARRIPRRLVAGFSAAAVVLGTAALIAAILRSGDQSEVATRREVQSTPSLGVDQVWPGPGIEAVDRSEPAATAESFIHDVLGEEPAQLAPDPAAPPNGPTWVDVTLSNGTVFRVLTVPEPDGWVVLQVGDAVLGYSVDFAAVTIDTALVSAARVDLLWRDTAGVHTERVAESEIQDGRIPITLDGALMSAVVVFRETSDAPIAVYGGHFAGPPDAVPERREMAPEEVYASLASGCRPGDPNATFTDPQTGATDYARVPLWVPVVGAPNGTFKGCGPRVLAFPELDNHVTEEQYAIRAGVKDHVPPLPVFLPDGTLAGYLVPDVGYVDRAIAEANDLVKEPMRRTPPSPLEFAVVVGPEPAPAGTG